MSKLIDERGAIIHPQVLANYERICGRSGGIGCGHPQRVQSAEAYLRLLLRLERSGKLHLANIA